MERGDGRHLLEGALQTESIILDPWPFPIASEGAARQSAVRAPVTPSQRYSAQGFLQTQGEVFLLHLKHKN